MLKPQFWTNFCSLENIDKKISDLNAQTKILCYDQSKHASLRNPRSVMNWSLSLILNRFLFFRHKISAKNFNCFSIHFVCCMNFFYTLTEDFIYKTRVFQFTWRLMLGSWEEWEVPHKIWARSVQPILRLLDTNKDGQLDKQNIYIDKVVMFLA